MHGKHLDEPLTLVVVINGLHPCHLTSTDKIGHLLLSFDHRFAVSRLVTVGVKGTALSSRLMTSAIALKDASGRTDMEIGKELMCIIITLVRDVSAIKKLMSTERNTVPATTRAHRRLLY